jgi:hypothetical protein
VRLRCMPAAGGLRQYAARSRERGHERHRCGLTPRLSNGQLGRRIDCQPSSVSDAGACVRARCEPDRGRYPGSDCGTKAKGRLGRRRKAEYRACEKLAGSGKTQTVAEASSLRLRRGQELETEQITSAVTVLSNEGAVEREFALLGSPALRKCAARALTHNIDDKSICNARWGRVTVSKLPVHAPGTDATFGIRIVAKLNLPFSEVSVPIYFDVLGFAMGRAEVALTATSITQPVPSSTEQELLALLLSRARARPL